MKKLALFIVLFSCSFAYGRGGPKYQHDKLSPQLDDEINNVYEDMSQDLYNGGRIASGTISNLTVSTLTYTTLNPSVTSSIYQWQQGTITASTSTTVTGAFIKTGLLATITPASTSHRILLLVNAGRLATGTASVCFITVKRNGNDIGGTNGFSEWDNNGAGGSPAHITYIDSPASTSSLTYEVYMKGSAGTTSVCDSNMTCSIIAAEIN